MWKPLEAPQIFIDLRKNKVSKAISQSVWVKVPCSSTAELKNILSTSFKNHCDRSVRRLFPKSDKSFFFFFLLPTSVARKQLTVPEIVYGRVSVVWEVFPVSAAVCGCGGKCLSVHLQVHQFVAWAGSVCGVAAAALGTNQTQDQREESHTWRYMRRLKNGEDTNSTNATTNFFCCDSHCHYSCWKNNMCNHLIPVTTLSGTAMRLFHCRNLFRKNLNLVPQLFGPV